MLYSYNLIYNYIFRFGTIHSFWSAICNMYFDLALSFQFACNYPLSAQPCCRVYPGLDRPLVPLGFCQSGSFRFVCMRIHV